MPVEYDDQIGDWSWLQIINSDTRCILTSGDEMIYGCTENGWLLDTACPYSPYNVLTSDENPKINQTQTKQTMDHRLHTILLVQ